MIRKKLPVASYQFQVTSNREHKEFLNSPGTYFISFNSLIILDAPPSLSMHHNT